MNQHERGLLAEAIAIQAALSERQPKDCRDDQPPIDEWSNLLTVSQQIERAEGRGWRLAAARLREHQLTNGRILQNELRYWLSRRETTRTITKAPSIADLYRDLVALEAEFEEVKVEKCVRGRHLCVTTAPIELEEIRFGPFQIRLDCSQTSQGRRSYRVVALDPNPAAKDEAVTHPHVQDEFLCAGQGVEAIEQALQDGRLYDFFLIVHQILRTYSRGSAYVELDDWSGKPCRDCGCTTSEDTRHDCDRCEGTLCDECALNCHDCGNSFCSDCLSTCAHCHLEYCANCLSRCEQCRAAVCSGCQETETLCTKCHEREQAESDDDGSESDECESDESESAESESDDVESDEIEREEAESVASAES